MALLAKRLIDSQSVTLILGSLSDEQCSRLWGQDLRQLLDSPLWNCVPSSQRPQELLVAVTDGHHYPTNQ
jgi:hypothetical protein